MSGVVVFLGPSLPLEEARRHLDATFLPPVTQGDVLRVLDESPAAIGIVDGLFQHVPAVWHKEILAALERGVHVAGAASIGALRAAELDAFGMVGVGEIYAQYRSGGLVDDDEVAVAHADADLGWRPLSEAMVNVRDQCRRAMAARVLTAAAAATVVSIAKATYYPDRRYPLILQRARDAGAAAGSLARFEAWLRTSGPTLKARDTLALLRHLRGTGARRRTPARRPWRLVRTEFFEALQLEVEQEASGVKASKAGPGVSGATRLRLEREVLLRELVGREAARRGIEVSDAEVRAFAAEFRRRRGLRRRERALAWLRRRGLGVQRFMALMQSEALISRVAAEAHGWEIEQGLADEWRLRRLERPSRGGAVPP